MPPRLLKLLIGTLYDQLELVVALSQQGERLSQADFIYACDAANVPPSAREALLQRFIDLGIVTRHSDDALALNTVLANFLNHYANRGQLTSATFLAEQFQHMAQQVEHIQHELRQAEPDTLVLVTHVDHLATQLRNVRHAATSHYVACMHLMGDLKRNDQHQTLAERIELLQQAQRRHIDPLAELIAPQTNTMAQLYTIRQLLARLQHLHQSHELQRLGQQLLDDLSNVERHTLRHFGELIEHARTILASLVTEKSRKEAVALALGHLDLSWEVLRGQTISAPQRRIRRMSILDAIGEFLQDVLDQNYLPEYRPLVHTPVVTHSADTRLLTSAQLRTMIAQAGYIASWPQFVIAQYHAYPVHEQLKAICWPLLRSDPQIVRSDPIASITIQVHHYVLNLHDFAVTWQPRSTP